MRESEKTTKPDADQHGGAKAAEAAAPLAPSPQAASPSVGQPQATQPAAPEPQAAEPPTGSSQATQPTVTPAQGAESAIELPQEAQPAAPEPQTAARAAAQQSSGGEPGDIRIPTTLSESLDRNVHIALISSPSRFIGELHTVADMFLRIAWPAFHDAGSMQSFLEKNATTRHYFAFGFRVEPEIESARNLRIIPNYYPLSEDMAIGLSVFFGKQFDSNGLIQSHGMFHVPTLAQTQIPYHEAGPYNDKPRNDLGIELNLSKASTIARLFTTEFGDSSARRTFFNAGKFYLRGLRGAYRDPEAAYIDLIMAGEIISQHKDFDEAKIYDDDLKRLFQRLTDLGVKTSDVETIKKRLYQVKRRFVLAITSLLTSKFFAKTDSVHEWGSLRAVDIAKRVAAAYDVRSQYVHKGRSFVQAVIPPPQLSTEVNFGRPVMDDKDFAKILERMPTFWGMERIVRFCLLRIVHTELLKVHEDLDDDPLAATATPSVEKGSPGLTQSFAPDEREQAIPLLGNHIELGPLDAARPSKEKESLASGLPVGIGAEIMKAFGLAPSRRVGELKRGLEVAIESNEIAPHLSAEAYITFLQQHAARFGLSG